MAPDFVRYFIRDSIEALIGYAGGLTLVSIFGLGDPAPTVHAIAFGVATALVAAARRNRDRFIKFVNDTLHTEPEV